MFTPLPIGSGGQRKSSTSLCVAQVYKLHLAISADTQLQHEEEEEIQNEVLDVRKKREEAEERANAAARREREAEEALLEAETAIKKKRREAEVSLFDHRERPRMRELHVHCQRCRLMALVVFHSGVESWATLMATLQIELSDQNPSSLS